MTLGLEGRTILLVEDNFVIGQDLAQRLTSLGLRVCGPFPTVERARKAWAETACDFALLDVNLRGGTSLPLALELVAAGIPTLFVTGYSEIPDLPAALASVPRLSKPLHLGQLLQVLLSLQESGR